MSLQTGSASEINWLVAQSADSRQQWRVFHINI